MQKDEEILIAELTKQLEQCGLAYAVLRNYENFPSFGNDMDLVVAQKCMPEFRMIAATTAKKLSWTTLTECHHWSDKRAPHLNIEVFRFYRHDPDIMIQVDAFHGFSIYSLPLFSETELLEGRVKSTSGVFSHINQNQENLFRMLQIHSLRASSTASEKIIRYRERVIDHLRHHSDIFKCLIREKFGPHGEAALTALHEDSLTEFNRHISAAKKTFVRNYTARHPLKMLTFSWRRLLDLSRQYVFDPCGGKFLVHITNSAALNKLRDQLRSLHEEGILYAWSADHIERRFFTRSERRVMERGGLVLKHIKYPHQANLTLDANTTSEEIRHCLLQFLIERHPALFEHHATQDS